ncbi:MAG: SpoIIE family protein phosphatase [Verrucomicrobiota bacterium]
MMMDSSADDGSGTCTEKLGRLELALRASNEGIWDWWTRDKSVYYSRRILEFLECGPDHAPNLFLEPWNDIHPEDREAFGRAVRKALATGGVDNLAVDARARTGAGEWRWLRIRGAVVRDREGHALRIAGSIIDISLRKSTEEQLAEERHLLHQLIDHVPLQIYFKDENSNFVMANERMAQWMGRESTAELIGKHDRDFFDEAHWKPARIDEERIMTSGEPVANKVELETWREGSETWVLTSKFPWRDRAGTIKGTFGVSSDVTSLVLARKEAADLASELQRKNDAYEEELQLAREIQQALTNRPLPSISNEHISARFLSRYIPISGLAGDFFEVIELSPGRAGVLICDVMGHGIRSALVVAMLRGLLETQRSQADDPAAFLNGLNDGLVAILHRGGAGMFATAFYGFIDLNEGMFSFACAGHPGPIIQTDRGVAQIPSDRTTRGPGLGLMAGVSYVPHRLPIAGLKRLILFTDGVLEAENSTGEPFFEKRLMKIISEDSTLSLDDLLDDILRRILEFSGSGQFDDDVCLLAMQVGPSE